jgi:uncharacterized lipoprotein YmbA
MIKNKRFQCVFMFLGAVMLILYGCVGGKTKPANIYILRALPESEGATTLAGGTSILIGPVSMSAYLDRTHLVTAASNNQLKIDEFNRWAEPLKDIFIRVIGENLSNMLDSARIYIYPHRRAVRADYQIEIIVTRFDTDVDGQAWLTAYWSIIGKDGKKELLRKRTVIKESAEPNDYGAIVVAHNKTLLKFCREIAAEIKKLK